MRYFLIFFWCVCVCTLGSSQIQDTITYQTDTVQIESGPLLLPQLDHPFSLARGRISGLMYSLPGSDPNGIPRIRVGGLFTLEQDDAPLIIVDGLPQANPLSVDPAAIRQIQVIQDPVALTRQGGLLGGTGIIRLETARTYPDSGVVWRYRNHFTTENRRFKYETASINELSSLYAGSILRLGETDWQEEIVRTAFSMGHHLDGRARLHNWLISGHLNFRDRQGIGRKSDYQQLSLGLNLGVDLLNNKMRINGQASLFTRNAGHDNNAIFTQALLMQPYFPIRFAGNNSDPQAQGLFNLQAQTGGYAQSGMFGLFNPVAIQDQSDLRSERSVWTTGLAVQWELAEGLQMKANYTRQQSNADFIRRYLRESFYPHRGLTSNNPGQADWDRRDQQNQFYQASLQYTRNYTNWQNLLVVGADYQDTRLEQAYQIGRGYADNEFFFQPFASTPERGASDFQTLGYAENHKRLAYFADYTTAWRDWIELRLVGRTATSTRIGPRQNWAFFPAAGLKLKWPNVFSSQTDLHLRLAYGQTGNLPNNSLKTKGERSEDGILRLEPNPNLSWETRTSYNAGLDVNLLGGQIMSSLDYYRSNTRDLIYLARLSLPPSISQRQHANLPQIQIENASWQFRLDGNFLLGSFLFQPFAHYSTYQSVLAERAGKTSPYHFVRGESINTTHLRIIAGGGFSSINEVDLGELGQIVTFRLDQTATNAAGEPILVDSNSDGVISEEDKSPIASGLPGGGWGFGSRLSKNRWSLQFLLRGETGYSLAHSARINAEIPLPFFQFPINIIQTEYYEAGWRTFFQFNDYYVEKADYLMLDFLQLSYRLNVSLGQRQTALEVYVQGRNLWLSSQYTGDDPSARFADGGLQSENGQVPAYFFTSDPRVAGIDRMGEYPLARSFSLGINWQF